MLFVQFEILLVSFGGFWIFVSGSLTEFNDKLAYDISWNGPLSEQAEKENTLEKIVLTTKENEQYQCFIPYVKDHEEEGSDSAIGPAPEVLMSDVLTSTPRKCSYRLEPYWTYEVCHGKSVIQFHEEKDKNGNVKRDEYILGQMTDAEAKELVHGPKSTGDKKKVPVTRIEGQDTPYYSVEMGKGTPCDLNGNPRKSSVMYICHMGANNEVVSVKEVTTCEYEIIVLSPLICANPAYIIKKDPINDINCHPLPGHPSRPVSLIEHYSTGLLKMGKEPQKRVPQQKQPKQPVKPSNDLQLNKQFLSGDYCLVGGSGWWSYEFCNGKYIQQFHEEPNTAKVVINLGFWNKEEHIKMVQKGAIVPKGKNNVMHFYMGGDICDLTGKPRQAIVILTCIEGTGQQLGIYMSEQSPCEYTIGVESPILCPFVKNADENGLFQHT